jgi:hypothetical protein
MQTRNFLLASIAAVAFAGSVGLALASPAFHRMTVQLPDGGTAQIQYSGNVAPRVTFDTNPFMAMDRISDEMDREMDALMDAADFSPMPLWAPVQPFAVGLRDAAPDAMQLGAMQYTAVSTALGNGAACTQTMSVTRDGNGRPKVVSHSYGHCGAMAAHSALSHEPYELRGHHDRGTIETKAPPVERQIPSSLVEAAYRPAN